MTDRTFRSPTRTCAFTRRPVANSPQPWSRLRWPLALLINVVLPLALAQGVPSSTRTDTHQLRTGIAYGDRLVWMSDAELGSALDTATFVGAHLVRADLSWSNIQPAGPDSYSWHLFDRVVTAATARGLTVLPVLAYTPPWARPQGCVTEQCGPRDPAAFATFAQEAAKRYAPQGVHVWEIWNEPNVSAFWGPASEPAAYTALLKATAEALRHADPRAFVVLGGLAATNTGGGNLAQTDFLAKVSALGGNRVIDAVGYHPYTYPFLPSSVTRWGTPWEKIDKTRVSLRSVLAKFGTPGLSVWITEVGAPTGGPGVASDGSHATIGSRTTHVTEALQARIAADAVRTATADPGIDTLIWYTDHDQVSDASTAEDFYGLYRADGTAKPALNALREVIVR